MIKTCKNKHIIDVVMKADYWRAVWINGIVYFRTFDDNVIYHSGLHIERSLPKSNFLPLETFVERWNKTD